MRVPSFQLCHSLPNWILRIKEASFEGKWNQVFSYYVHLRSSGVRLTDPTTVVPPVLKACLEVSSTQGKSIHCCLIKQGNTSFSAIGNSILDFYVKCGELGSAVGAFECMGGRDSVSWNIIVRGFLDKDDSVGGLWWFRKAIEDMFQPNVSTLVLVVHACRNLKVHVEGRTVHGYIIRVGFYDVCSVQNSLLSMYVDADMKDAHSLFDEIVPRDVISWSVMISGYVQNKEAHVGLEMFKEMICKFRVEPDGKILVSVLNGCAALGDLSSGRSCHGLAVSRGLNSDVFVENSLIDMYSKCKDVESAVRIFSEMSQSNKISWNCLLSGLVLNEKYSEALLLYYSLLNEGVESDEVTLMSILQLCKYYAHQLESKSVHCVIIRKGHETNEFLLNSLVDAYAKCDMIDLAWKTFIGLKQRDVVSWSTMIAGFTNCGKPDGAIAVFQEMSAAQVKPNAVTITNLLEACSVLAEIRRAKWAHGIATREEMATDVMVSTSIVDMYAKCGVIDTSRKAFDHLPQKNIYSWSAMIAAYGMNGLAQESLALIKEMQALNMKPNAVTCLSVLSACSHGGLVEEGLLFFKSMIEDHGIEPGAEHYSCMVDMLGRAGKLNCAMELIMKMPERLRDSASLWGTLLSACRNLGDSELGDSIVSHAIHSEPLSSAGYMLASSMYASSGLWASAARMRRLVRERRIRVVAGYSLVHIGDRACKFVAWDKSHPLTSAIYIMAEQLHNCSKLGTSDDLIVAE